MGYMKETAKIFGLDLEEKFMIEKDPCTYKFTEKGLFCKGKGNDWEESYCLDLMLINGYKIHKLPWKPELGDKYFTFKKIYGRMEIVEYLFEEDFMDYVFLKQGVVYRTFDEAKSSMKKVCKELMGEDL